MVAPVKTTAWGGLHKSLALILNDADYATVTKNIVTSSAPLIKLTTINPKINKQSTHHEILTLQKEIKTLQNEFQLRRLSPPSEYSTSSTALRNSTSKKSTKNTLVKPIKLSKRS
jgi:hypothetical protein